MVDITIFPTELIISDVPFTLYGSQCDWVLLCHYSLGLIGKDQSRTAQDKYGFLTNCQFVQLQYITSQNPYFFKNYYSYRKMH